MTEYQQVEAILTEIAACLDSVAGRLTGLSDDALDFWLCEIGDAEAGWLLQEVVLRDLISRERKRREEGARSAEPF